MDENNSTKYTLHNIMNMGDMINCGAKVITSLDQISIDQVI